MPNYCRRLREASQIFLNTYKYEIALGILHSISQDFTADITHLQRCLYYAWRIFVCGWLVLYIVIHITKSVCITHTFVLCVCVQWQIDDGNTSKLNDTFQINCTIATVPLNSNLTHAHNTYNNITHEFHLVLMKSSRLLVRRI